MCTGVERRRLSYNQLSLSCKYGTKVTQRPLSDLAHTLTLEYEFKHLSIYTIHYEQVINTIIILGNVRWLTIVVSLGGWWDNRLGSESGH